MDSVQRAVVAPVTAPAAALATARPVQAAQAEKPASPVPIVLPQAPRLEAVQKPKLDFDAKEMQQRLPRGRRNEFPNA